MKIIKTISILIIALAVGAIMFRACVIKIKPGETGVLNKQWGGGLQQSDYTPGYYLSLGPLHTWNVMDTTVQTLNMLRETPGKRGNRGRTQNTQQGYSPPIKVKSSDGADITLDISIKYHIADGKAWQVFKEQGSGDSYRNQVASRTTSTLSSGLGTLSTEQFFDPSQRTKTQKAMMEQLSTELGKIRISPEFSVVEVDASVANKVARTMKGKKIRGQKVDVRNMD